MIIAHNMQALNLINKLKNNNKRTSDIIEKLSSGLRINKSADDAAGLSISEKMKAQIRGLQQASRNAQDGISMIQTAEGALGNIHDILQRMRELSVQSANDTYTLADRQAIQNEIDELAKEIDRIANNTEFNSQKLIDGSKATSKKIDITANYIKIWTFSDNPINKDSIGIDDETTMKFARFHFHPLDSMDGNYVDTPIEDNLKFTLLSLKNTFDNLKAGNIGLLSEQIAVQNTDMYIYGNKVIITSSKHITASTGSASVSSTKSYTGSPATCTIEYETLDEGVNFQIGANAGQSMTVYFPDATARNIGVIPLSVFTASDASTAITKIDNAISIISDGRSRLGAYQNRLEHAIYNIDNASENLMSAESRIRDTDMAKEMMEFTKGNILNQTAQAMLAQANQIPQNVLNMLK